MPAFTGAEADAAACPSHGRNFPLLPPHPQAFPLEVRGIEWRTPVSLPLEGFAVLNDTPVACQTRGPTDPQGDRCPRRLTDEVLPPSPPQGLFRAPARATFVCGDKSSQKHRQKLRFCTSSARYACSPPPALSLT